MRGSPDVPCHRNVLIGVAASLVLGGQGAPVLANVPIPAERIAAAKARGKIWLASGPSAACLRDLAAFHDIQRGSHDERERLATSAGFQILSLEGARATLQSTDTAGGDGQVDAIRDARRAFAEAQSNYPNCDLTLPSPTGIGSIVLDDTPQPLTVTASFRFECLGVVTTLSLQSVRSPRSVRVTEIRAGDNAISPADLSQLNALIARQGWFEAPRISCPSSRVQRVSIRTQAPTLKAQETVTRFRIVDGVIDGLEQNQP